ncbi:MAG: MCE family protein [Deltaproteobacteria bacterium]|nr:MCE family protein [Deltaproteobacteria bacterium]
MSAQAHYFKIGLFVIIAVAIAVVAIVVLGAGAIFQKRVMVETYFDTSVQGLDRGSPVKYRGVQIGKVEDIALVAATYDVDRRHIMVRMSLVVQDLGDLTRDQVLKAIKTDVDKGLRVHLAPQGLTGTAYMEWDFVDPAYNPPMKIDWQSKYLYIPSTPNTIARLSDALDKVMRSFDKFDLQSLTSNMEQIVSKINDMLGGVDAKELSRQAVLLVAETRETNQKIGQLVLGAEKPLKQIVTDASLTMAGARRVMETSGKPLAQSISTLKETTATINHMAKNLDTFSAGLPSTLSQLRTTLERLDRLVAFQQQDIEKVVVNIRQISENVKELTENAKRYPAQSLFGAPPPKSSVGEKR